jgi:hypothetical protein
MLYLLRTYGALCALLWSLAAQKKDLARTRVALAESDRRIADLLGALADARAHVRAATVFAILTEVTALTAALRATVMRFGHPLPLPLPGLPGLLGGAAVGVRATSVGQVGVARGRGKQHTTYNVQHVRLSLRIAAVRHHCAAVRRTRAVRVRVLTATHRTVCCRVAGRIRTNHTE